jgi:hypothetical protein
MADHDYLWDPQAPPDPEIARLEEALRPLRHRDAPAPPLPLPRARRAWLRAGAGLAAAAVVAALVVVPLRRGPAPWTVTSLAGEVAAASVLRPGEWVETAAGGRARIQVGRIGRAELGPGSRARLLRAEGTEHRMALEQGTLRASIWAPPRYFMVETPAGLAVDLGCVYTLRVDERGRGMLRVASGQVELVRGSRRVVVPAGNQASLTPGVGPGLPFPSAAGPRFRAALRAWEAEGSPAALHRLLESAGGEATITLWYLLQRVDASSRGPVYDRLVEVAPLQPPVSRASALRLDAEALAAWSGALEPGWTSDSIPAYRRAWRRFRTTLAR